MSRGSTGGIEHDPDEYVVDGVSADGDTEAANLEEQGKINTGQGSEQENVAVKFLAIRPDVMSGGKKKGRANGRDGNCPKPRNL